MRTLGDAWAWYESARRNLLRMQRLGARHWDDLATFNAALLWRDDRFKGVEASDLARETALALEPLDDLAVLVLFSVFEAVVRNRLRMELEPLVDALEHPVLRHAAGGALEGVNQGSFANNVLAPLQEQDRVGADLVERVSQVRRYRNWIAHGKREPRPASVANLTPAEAFERLDEFLRTLAIPTQPTPPGSGGDPA